MGGLCTHPPTGSNLAGVRATRFSTARTADAFQTHQRRAGGHDVIDHHHTQTLQHAAVARKGPAIFRPRAFQGGSPGARYPDRTVTPSSSTSKPQRCASGRASPA